MTSREALDNAARFAAAGGQGDDRAAAVPEPPPAVLDPNAILIAEFEYARATALQANEDRARVSSYFLATVGSVVLALLGLKVDGLPRPLVAAGFAALFAMLAWMGLATLNQLVALRLAWRESCLAMNQVKAHFRARHPTLGHAFRWTDASLPPAYKPTSVSSQLALMVAVIMGVAAGAAVIAAVWCVVLVAGRATADPRSTVVAAVSGGLVALAVVARAAWLHYVARLCPGQAATDAIRPT